MAGNTQRVRTNNDLDLKDRLVAINRVTKVTKGGRTFSFSAVVVVGDEKYESLPITIILHGEEYLLITKTVFLYNQKHKFKSQNVKCLLSRNKND